MTDLDGATVVVTGANGFVGQHVAAAAREAGGRVVAIAREPNASPELSQNCDVYLCADLEHDWPVSERVDAVVHLAGLAAVGPSFSEPQRYLTVNSGIMTTMCEALLAGQADTRVVVVSSGSVYAPPRDGKALDENSATFPNSPYAVAKLLVETQAMYYSGRGLDTVIARPFNHIGPGQGPGFLVPDLVASLSTLHDGSQMSVGNLDAARDFTDVRDVARAYLTLAAAAEHRHPIYNVASGSAHTGRDVLEAAAHALGRAVPELVIDQRRLRPNDPMLIQGSALRLQSEFGWRPTIGWRQSITDYVLGLSH